MITSRTSITKYVRTLLEEHKITKAPVSVEGIAKKTDIFVQYLDLKDDVSGFSYHKDGKKMVGVNANESELRQRFTLAHELGHLHLGIEDLHYDQSSGIQFRSELASTGVDKTEIAANFFAAELLMPEVFLAADLKKVTTNKKNAEDVVSELARMYSVSEQAMNVRLASLGYMQSLIL